MQPRTCQKLAAAAICCCSLIACAEKAVEGIASTSSKYVPLPELKQGDIRRDKLTDTQLAKITKLQITFADADTLPLDAWVDNFKRDLNPDAEIEIYERIAEAYLSYIDGRMLSVDAKKDVYTILLLRSMDSEDKVISNLNLKVFTLNEAREVLKHFKDSAKPVTVE